MRFLFKKRCHRSRHTLSPLRVVDAIALRNASAICLASLLAACHGESERQSTPLLDEARKAESNFSPYAPKNPYKQVSEHLLERTVFETPGPPTMRIELRDLYVAPGTTAEKVTLPGPAILQVLSGQGKITTAEKSTDLNPGTTVTVAQDASSALEAQGITPLIVRARIFTP